MIDEVEARKRILDAVQPGDRSEPVALSDALGRTVASEILGQVDLPGFDNSSMDGYAVRSSEASSGTRLRVTGEQPAGEDRELRLGSGEAIRIFTGSPIPGGADAVIMQEDVRRDGNEIEVVEGVVPAENIRPRGADVCTGQRILNRGDRITPGRIGLLASQGYDAVTVSARPDVTIVATGDELIEPGSTGLKPGQIFNSNGPMLEALVRQFGGSPRRLHAPDDSAVLRETLSSAMADSQFVLIAGGVSVGDHDLVKDELTRLEVESDFWRVRIKPGKPFLFGQLSGSNPVSVLGLPGNPVSAFVTFLLFAAPALLKWQGATGLSPDTLPLDPISGPLAEPLTNSGDRPHYVRLKIDPDGAFRPAGIQQSHAVFGLSRANVLLRLEAKESLDAGAVVTGYRF